MEVLVIYIKIKYNGVEYNVNKQMRDSADIMIKYAGSCWLLAYCSECLFFRGNDLEHVCSSVKTQKDRLDICKSVSFMYDVISKNNPEEWECD